MEIGPVGDELFHAEGRTDRQRDRQTDVTKLIVAFRLLLTRLKTMKNNTSVERVEFLLAWINAQ